ncbi:MAG: HAD-IB family hydrolase [Gammaproteobacteria bacterium]|nr:HAD-IB family hydrolase [Gammaproteobacteria bacterium]
MPLAIFDLDNTLLGGDSDHAWGEFLIARDMVDATSHGAKNDEFYQQYTEGRLDIHDYVRFTLGPVLTYSLSELDKMHGEFMDEFIMPIILPRAVDLIEQHKRVGDHCLIMSATNAFITAPIARELGVHDLLATDLVIEGDYYTGDIAGVPCFQEGKVARLQQWIELQNDKFNIEESIFYSDSFNDLPLLKAVKVPVAVDPDEHLAEHARNNDWQIVSLR